jgi:hypothetical protein
MTHADLIFSTVQLQQLLKYLNISIWPLGHSRAYTIIYQRASSKPSAKREALNTHLRGL